MPGCERCPNCPGYESKNLIQATLTKLGGNAFTGCKHCGCHPTFHYH